MLDTMLECRDCATHLAGMTRHINDGIELLAGKRCEAVRFVAVHTDEASPARNCSSDASCAPAPACARAASGEATAPPRRLMNSRRRKRLIRMCPYRFEDGTSSYSKWHIAVRGFVTYFAVPWETNGMSASGTKQEDIAVQQVVRY